jgi:hypothetical protein
LEPAQEEPDHGTSHLLTSRMWKNILFFNKGLLGKQVDFFFFKKKS